MSRIRSKETLPERRVRKLVREMGLRYRKNVTSLPGKPDLANQTNKWAVLVHGCFWHSHQDCHIAKPPKTNLGYWRPKLRRNVERDTDHVRALRALGLNVLIVWECETRSASKLRGKLTGFFRKHSLT